MKKEILSHEDLIEIMSVIDFLELDFNKMKFERINFFELGLESLPFKDRDLTNMELLSNPARAYHFQCLPFGNDIVSGTWQELVNSDEYKSLEKSDRIRNELQKKFLKELKTTYEKLFTELSTKEFILTEEEKTLYEKLYKSTDYSEYFEIATLFGKSVSDRYLSFSKDFNINTEALISFIKNSLLQTMQNHILKEIGKQQSENHECEKRQIEKNHKEKSNRHKLKDNEFENYKIIIRRIIWNDFLGTGATNEAIFFETFDFDAADEQKAFRDKYYQWIKKNKELYNTTCKEAELQIALLVVKLIAGRVGYSGKRQEILKANILKWKKMNPDKWNQIYRASFRL